MINYRADVIDGEKKEILVVNSDIKFIIMWHIGFVVKILWM